MFKLNEFNQPLNFSVENWQPVNKPSVHCLKGTHCRIEAIDSSKHAEELYKVLQIDNHGESWTYLPYGPFETYEHFLKWLDETNALADTQLYAILDVNSEKPIGIAGYLRINPEHGVIEVGHLHFSKLLQRTAIATEAMYLMMKYVFDDLGYRRYEWKCDSLNQASCNAAKRLGFFFEGIFRQNLVIKGRNRDTAWFSVLDKEWPILKEKFQKWLQAENFDHNGNQLKKLTEM